MSKHAKALAVVLATIIGVLLKEAGLEEVPGDQIELAVSGLVVAATVWLVPNS